MSRTKIVFRAFGFHREELREFSRRSLALSGVFASPAVKEKHGVTHHYAGAEHGTALRCRLIEPSLAGNPIRRYISIRSPSAACMRRSSTKIAAFTSKTSTAATAPSSMPSALPRTRRRADRTATRCKSARMSWPCADPTGRLSESDHVIRARVEVAAVQPHALQPKRRVQVAEWSWKSPSTWAVPWMTKPLLGSSSTICCACSRKLIAAWSCSARANA